MKVLHFITSIDSADIYPSEYMSALLRCMGTQAEVHLATFRSTNAVDMELTKLHLFDYPKNIIDHSFEKSFAISLKQISPDIVHIHGCWDRTLWDVTRITTRANIPVVLSPHGALDPAILRTFFMTRRLPKLIAYQYRAALSADVLLSSTPEEEENLKDLLLNCRTVVIPDPRLVPETDYTQVSNQLLGLYRKTIDTTCTYRSLNEQEQEAIKTLLREGAANNEEPARTERPTIDLLNTLSDKSWRKIFIVSHDNHLEDVFAHAIDRLCITPPTIDVSRIDRFDYVVKNTPVVLPDDKLLYINPLQKSKIGNIADPTVKRLVFMLLNLRHLIKQGSLNLNHLVQLYKCMKYDNYDEDIFTQCMKPLRLKAFTEKAEILLQHFFGLTEGYMPIPACAPQKAHALINKTIKTI